MELRLVNSGENNMKRIFQSYLFYSDTTDMSWSWSKGEFASLRGQFQHCHVTEFTQYTSRDWANKGRFSLCWTENTN